MVDWKSQQELIKDSDALVHITYSMLGLVVWELLATCQFEWSLICGRRRFRWPLVFPFFITRYAIVLALIGLIVADEVTTKINCRALYTFNSFSGNMTILCASMSLLLRTIALWERRLSIVIFLGIACLGHWVLLWYGMFVVVAEWNPALGACAVVASDPTFLRITLFYTMAFDFTIMCFTWLALFRSDSRSHLWRLLFQDGLVFFLVSFAMNAIPAVLNVLNLNTAMNVIATVPAAAISSVAACRCVLRLQEYARSDVYVHSVAHISPTSNAVQFRAQRTSIGGGGISGGNAAISKMFQHGSGRGVTGGPQRPEVHVTTEHITMAEFSPMDKDAEAFDDVEVMSKDALRYHARRESDTIV